MDITPERGPIGVVGLGTIGQRWAATFAHHGYEVSCYDPDPARWEAFQALHPALIDDLEHLAPARVARGPIRFSTDLGKALVGAAFVQESGPERLDLKQELLAAIERNVGEEVVIASSSSALLVSEMQAKCARPQRVVLAHPFNPVHLMPLVEIVGGRETSPEVVEQTRAFYDALGKKPAVLRKEVTGHLALRLMGAMWREAIALVESGVASAEDVDRAFCYGPGPKWTLQGSFISNHLNADGIESFLTKYGKTYQDIWDDLGDAKLQPETITRVSREVREAIGERSDAELRDQRDAGLVDLLRVMTQRAAL
ncbi:3-hydroxyacyl-CoA dehydrogenase NAD-binding domain-containing protein [Bosea rubneri]|uniref:3-hydroxyacyl-CoA dehydrogenase NAD-binding domain-containing protein n=1 Tax=Bosea rubneri TaxID=3075434 RepID=A0ABU3SDS0_9HYPH|nr:3-hydroxyacyl-CoA dehydrogenase NAD-binding domain-containing protein [Bosea sp. ZW T0_25]MDU0342940.1 3-hydroxyacyl-CoA dehydrogenase NAD-binding domain-containing protein [Bosea sp. ZW T0_25]